MTGAKPLDELLDTLRREMHALDAGDRDARQRLDRLIADIEARPTAASAPSSRRRS